MKIRYKVAKGLVWAANRLMKDKNLPGYWPYYRPIDTYMEGIGHEFSCGAYSYEGLKSLVEQDGPEGFGARATIKWLIGIEGWKKIEDMSPREVRRTFAMSGIDMEDTNEE